MLRRSNELWVIVNDGSLRPRCPGIAPSLRRESRSQERTKRTVENGGHETYRSRGRVAHSGAVARLRSGPLSPLSYSPVQGRQRVQTGPKSQDRVEPQDGSTGGGVPAVVVNTGVQRTRGEPAF